MKGKRGKWEDVAWETDGETISVEDTQYLQQEKGDDRLPDNPPPGPKWKAKKALCRMNLNGAEYVVFACLIDRANGKTGLCYPSEEFIAGWTSRLKRTVRRAIDTLKSKRLIMVIDRGTTSNRYVIQWRPLFEAYAQIERFETESKNRREQKEAPQDSKSGPTSRQKVAPKPYGLEPWKHNPGHEVAHPPSAADAVVSFFERKKGIRGEPVGRPSPFARSPEPPEGSPSRQQAETTLSASCTAFDWYHLKPEAYEAAVAAEIEAPGTGAAAMKAASHEAWRARRKGAVNE
jgi:hypothetical protein